MAEVGRITQVTVDRNERRVFVDVQVSPNRQPSGIPYRTPANSVWVVPEVGDTVEVNEVGGERVAFSPYNSSPTTPPKGLDEGDVALQVSDETYVIIDKSDDEVRIQSKTDVHVEAEKVYVGDDDNTKRVATEDHTHGGEVSKPGDSGLTQNEVE
jgi:hypothetical protein